MPKLLRAPIVHPRLLFRSQHRAARKERPMRNGMRISFAA
jgi:hypothetical protein